MVGLVTGVPWTGGDGHGEPRGDTLEGGKPDFPSGLLYRWLVIEGAQEADMERLLEMVIMTELFHDSLSVGCLMLADRSLLTGPGSMVGSPVAEVVVVQVEDILLSKPGGRLLLRRFGMASLSTFSGPSSESEQVCVSGGRRGRWRGCRLICVLRRLLTAFRELKVLGGREGSARRSEIKP